MTKKTGLGQRFYIGGYAIHGDVGSFQRIAGGPAALEVTGVDKEAFERIGGKRDGGIDFSTFFNDASGQEHAALKGLPTADVIATLLTAATAGAPACSCVAKQVDYNPTRGDDGSLTFAVQTLSNGFGVDWGTAMTAGTRQDTTATNGASVDFGAAQGGAFGGQLFVQLNAFTGTSVTVKVQSSSDDGAGDAFADVATFTTAALTSAPAAVRIAYTGGALERYLRLVTVGTFSVADFAAQITVNDTTVSF